MSDPWTPIPLVITWELPQWIIDYYVEENPDQEVNALWVVSMWLENMEANIYDVARDEGKYPVPIVMDEDR